VLLLVPSGTFLFSWPPRDPQGAPALTPRGRIGETWIAPQ